MTTKEQLDERYGRAPHPARPPARCALWIILAGTAAAVVGAALSRVTVSNSADDVGFDEADLSRVLESP